MIKSKGFSLIEMLIALLLSAALLVLLCRAKLCLIINSNYVNSTSSTQLKLQTARAILQNDIREAGYMGCPRLTAENMIVSPDLSLSFNPQHRISGSVRDQNDEITVQHLVHPTVQLTATSDADIVIFKNSLFSENDVVLIADCEHGEIFRIKKIYQRGNTTIIVPTSPLHSHFNLPATLGLFTKTTYFIGPTARKDHLKIIYALMEENLAGERIELVPELNKMTIHYLINEAGLLKDYIASDVNDWSEIVGVKITLVANNKMHDTLMIALRA